MAHDGEEFLALNEKSYILDNKALGICDDEGVQCLGRHHGRIKQRQL